ncbi:MAG: DUF5662 family protein [Chloroflexi bacterium]|nr:DUF5662 family protein [Chloroflexota bacterium]
MTFTAPRYAHYAVSPHHPEYHAAPIRMSFLDIIEMVADWDAASRTYGRTSLREGLSVHRLRFAFSDAQWWLIEQVVGWLEPPVNDRTADDHRPDR